ELAQEVGDAIRALTHLFERPLLDVAAVTQEAEGRTPVAGCEDVEIVQRPVEAVEDGPAKAAVRGVVVLTMGEKKVSRAYECVCPSHGAMPSRKRAGRVAQARAVGKDSPPGALVQYPVCFFSDKCDPELSASARRAAPSDAAVRASGPPSRGVRSRRRTSSRR